MHLMQRKIPQGHGPRKNSAPKHQSTNSEPWWASLPYISGISEALTRNIKAAQTNTTTLKTNLVKDTIPLDAKSGVIYHFSSNGCNSK